MAPFQQTIVARLRLLRGLCKIRNVGKPDGVVSFRDIEGTQKRLGLLRSHGRGALMCGVWSGVVWDLAFSFLCFLLCFGCVFGFQSI